jgi:hypothetical protein
MVASGSIALSYALELPLQGGALARLRYYRTNYGKITSIRDRLFQFTRSRRIFASFDIFGCRYPILPSHQARRLN